MESGNEPCSSQGRRLTDVMIALGSQASVDEFSHHLAHKGRGHIGGHCIPRRESDVEREREREVERIREKE